MISFSFLIFTWLWVCSLTGEREREKEREYPSALAGVAQWIECRPVNQKVAGSIPSLVHIPGLLARSPVGGMEVQPHIDVSLPLFLPPFLSLQTNE